MRILIAGGAGYIGSALIPELLDRGYNVVIVDLLWFGNSGNCRGHSDLGSFSSLSHFSEKQQDRKKCQSKTNLLHQMIF